VISAGGARRPSRASTTSSARRWSVIAQSTIRHVCNPSHWRDTASPPMFRIVCAVPRPGVKPRAADIQHAAHQLDRVLGLLCGDEPERSRAPRWACGPRGAAAAGRRARRSSGPPRGPRRRGSGGSNCAATAARPPSSASELRNRLAVALEQADHLTAELGRIRSWPEHQAFAVPLSAVARDRVAPRPPLRSCALRSLRLGLRKLDPALQAGHRGPPTSPLRSTL
jgi:hypothetical protein